jgi:hypothetical protein
MFANQIKPADVGHIVTQVLWSLYGKLVSGRLEYAEDIFSTRLINRNYMESGPRPYCRLQVLIAVQYRLYLAG